MFKELSKEERKDLIEHLEDRLMDLIEISSRYEDLPAVKLELEMYGILSEIEHLEQVKD